MTAGFEWLPWDSEFFGVSIGRIDSQDEPLRDIVRAADADGVDCLYLLVDAVLPARVVEAEAVGFRTYDVRVEFERVLGGDESSQAAIRVGTTDDRSWLDPLLRTRFRDTRFFNDPRFPVDRSAELYVAWLDRAFATPERRAVLAAESRAGAILIDADRATGTGTIELIAVAEASAGQGVGRALVGAAGAASAADGLSRVRVVTQGSNIAAQRLYQRCGYRTISTSLWLHRWRDAG